MSSTGTRITLDWGYIQYDYNEVQIVSTVDDPPAVRLGKLKSAGPGRSLGKISFNIVRPDGIQDEVVMLQGKRRSDDPNDVTGEILVSINNGNATDAGMVDVVVLRHDGIESRVPISAPNFSAVPQAPIAAWPNKLVSPDGHVELDIQNADALGLVAYVDGMAFWSAEHGWIRR